MVSNNALQFKIQFIEDANSINDLIRRVTERLNGAQIRLSLGDVDITKVSGNLAQLETSIREVQNLFNKTGDAASFAGMADGLRNATQSMETLKATLTELNNTLSNSLGTNIGNAIVQGLAQANEAIGTTMANLQKMNELASNKDVPKDLNEKVNLDLAKTKIAEIDNLLTSIGKQLEAHFKMGFDVGELGKYHAKLFDVQQTLKEIVRNEGAGKRVDAILRDAHFGELKVQATAEVKAVNEVSVAVEKLKAAFDSLQNVKGADKLKNDIQELQKQLQGNGGIKLLQSEHVNRYYKSLLDQTNEAVKNNAKAEKVQQQEQSKTAQETEKAQRAIQREIDATRQKFMELYAAQVKLREKSFFSGVDASGAIGETQRRLTALLNQMRQMESMMKASPQQMTAFAQSDSLKTWRQDFEAGMKIAREGIKSITDSLKIDNLLSNLSSRFSELLQLGRNAANLGFRNLANDAYDAAAHLRQVSRELEKIQNTGFSSKGLTFNEYMRTGEFSKVISESNRAKQDVERSIRQQQQATLRQNRTEATNEINRLKRAMQEINAIQAKSPGIKINGVEKALQDIQRIINLLEQARERGRNINLIQSAMGNYSAQNAPQLIAQLAQNQQAAAAAAAQHEQAQQRMSQAIAKATGEAQQQSQVLSDLRSMAMQYLSVWGAFNFVKEVAQITGELELQQKSLEVIIGSAGKAQELFNDIKGMSQMSPYTFQNLLKTTRQLAAFGIETKDLYGTMKQLSDIGAGLDVDVQRLVLAYGHIKSSGVLTGIQRRQLETAGIGITAELAKMYNDQYRASGSSERVTAEDVFKRIRDRQVTFEDVEKVFNRLTGPGGKFENMQLKQYETLGGKLRNLQNNYNIMLDEIGKAHMGLLMGGVNTLNSLMENWQKWAQVIKAVGAGLIAVKVAQAALGKSVMAHRAATLTSRAIERETLIASNLGTPVPLPPAGRVMLGESYAQKINDSQMNRFQKARAVMYKNVTASARELLLVEQGFNPVYAARVAQMKGMELAFHRLRMGALSFFTTMRAGLVALATNPMTWIFVAIAGITALTSRLNELANASKTMRDNIQKTEKEDLDGIREVFDSLPDEVSKSNVNGILRIDKNSIPSGEIESMMSSLDEALQKFDPLYKGHLFDIEGMKDDKDKVEAMVEDLAIVQLAKEEAKNKAAMLAMGNEKTGGILKSTFTEEIKEFQDEYIKVLAQIETLASKYEINPFSLKIGQNRDLGEEIKKFYNDADVVTGDMIRGYLSSLATLKVFNFSLEGVRINNTDMKSKIGASIRKYYEGINPTIVAEMKKMQKQDPTGKLGAVFLKEILDNLFSTEGMEITDDKTKNAITQAILLAINDSLAETDPSAVAGFQNGALKQFLNNIVKEEADKFLATRGDISKEDPAKLRADYFAYFTSTLNTLNALIPRTKNGADVMKELRDSIDEVWKTLQAGTNVDIDIKPWQQKIKDALNLEKFDDVKTRLNIQVGAEADIKEFIKATQESYGKCKKEAEEMARNLNIGARLGLKITPEVMFGSTKQIQMLRDKMESALMGALKEGGVGSERYKELRDMYKPLIELLDTLLDLRKISKESNIDFAGTKPGASNAEKEKKEKKSAEDKAERERRKAAEEARRKEEKHYENLISMIAELRREYKRLRDEGFNQEGAMLGVKDYYDRMFKGKGVIEWEKLNTEDITSVSPYLENIGKLIDASKLLDQEAKERLKRRALEQLMQTENVSFRERSDEVLNEFNKELEAISVGFEELRKILSATGDELLAGDVSGYGLGAAAGKMSSMIEEYLDMALGLKLGGKYKEIDYGEVAKLDEKGIEEYVKGLYGDKETAYIVKAVSQALKEYRKAIKNENKDALEAYTKAISSAMDYGSQIARIEQEANDAILKIRESGLPVQQQQRAIDIVTANRDMKMLEASNQYKRFFNGIFSEPRKEMEEMSRTIADTLLRQLRSGAISADEYAKKIEEVNKVMREFDQKDSDAWWNKGFFDNRTMEQRIEDARNKGQEIYSKASDEYQQAMAKGDQKGTKDALDMMSKGQSMMKGANNAALAMAIIDKVVHGIDKSIQGTVKAFNYLKDALEALGVESDTMSSIGDYLGTIGEMSGHVTASWDAFKSGDFFGASVEAFGAITSLITGFSQAHDNRLQRKIDKIQFETEKMNNTLDTIKSLRERQLGYDNGNMRLMLAAMYTQNGNHGRSDAASQAMIDYYTRYSGGSGYEQELALLEEQRQKLLEIYNLEDEKKKSSKEDLEDYKKQIADLDEQIHFFVEDLAKELWGIDLKGWADQLGDALMTAFENGTSAASAFHDTVQDIMRNMVKSMLVTSVIEPAMKNLSEKLFGKDGNGGLLNLNDPKGSMGAVLAELGNWFNNEGPKLMDAANEFYNGADNMMRQTLGYGMRENEKSSNTVNSIQSAASEETMGIVAGYLSRISQDVSVQRIMQEMFVNGSWPSYIEQVTSANNSLTAIDRSTTAMMEMMRDGNGALYERVENMSRRLDNFANGIDRIYIN